MAEERENKCHKAVSRCKGRFTGWLAFVLRARTLILAVGLGLLLQSLVLPLEAQSINCFDGPFPPDQNPNYFPTETFSSRWAHWAALSACPLRAMKEDPLFPLAAAPGRRVYRLTVSPTWDGLWIVRLEIRPDGSGTLVKKQARSQFDAGTLAVNAIQDIPEEKVRAFAALIEKNGFWSMPTIPVSQRDPRVTLLGMGGILGVLEGAKSGTYHVVVNKYDYYLPPTAPFDALASYLFKGMAHFDIPPPSMPLAKRKH